MSCAVSSQIMIRSLIDLSKKHDISCICFCIIISIKIENENKTKQKNLWALCNSFSLMPSLLRWWLFCPGSLLMADIFLKTKLSSNYPNEKKINKCTRIYRLNANIIVALWCHRTKFNFICCCYQLNLGSCTHGEAVQVSEALPITRRPRPSQGLQRAQMLVIRSMMSKKCVSQNHEGRELKHLTGDYLSRISN